MFHKIFFSLVLANAMFCRSSLAFWSSNSQSMISNVVIYNWVWAFKWFNFLYSNATLGSTMSWKDCGYTFSISPYCFIASINPSTYSKILFKKVLVLVGYERDEDFSIENTNLTLPHIVKRVIRHSSLEFPWIIWNMKCDVSSNMKCDEWTLYKDSMVAA